MFFCAFMRRRRAGLSVERAMSCSEAERAVAKEWTQTPHACVFINNRVVRTKPRSKPIVNPGLVRDVQTKDNIAHAEQAPQDAAWFYWFL